MKINEAVFYQSVRLPAPSNRETHRANAQSSETAGVEMKLIKGCVVISHASWKEDCIVGLANVRYLKMDKDSFDPPMNTPFNPTQDDPKPVKATTSKAKKESKAE